MLYVSVSRHTIERNAKENRNDPPFEIRRSKDDPNPQRVHSCEYHGTIRLIYDPNAPLISHAYCWIEIDEIGAEHVHALHNALAAEHPQTGLANGGHAPPHHVINVGVCEAANVVDGG